MNEDIRVVFQSSNKRQSADRALVLAASDIPHEVIEDARSYAIVVPAEFSAAAAEELRLFDEENPPAIPQTKIEVENQDPLPGLIGYVLFVCLVAGLAGNAFFDLNWFRAGRVDGELIRQGEVWRLFTALTLHSGVKHLLANLVFGVFFGLFAGRLLGSGVAWLAIVLAAATGNAVNALLLDASHRSIGASTAVFAALGLVSGFVWRGKLMAQGHWSNRFGPIVGGLALLMYTGTGAPDSNTDVGAHLLGFVFGFLAGLFLVQAKSLPDDSRAQLISGIAAAGLIVMSWLTALSA